MKSLLFIIALIFPVKAKAECHHSTPHGNVPCSGKFIEEREQEEADWESQRQDRINHAAAKQEEALAPEILAKIITALEEGKPIPAEAKNYARKISPQ